MSDEIPDLQKGFIHAHKRMLSALRDILAFIGVATLAVGAAAATMPVLSGAIWERLAGAWGSWSDPIDTIVSAVVTALVAVLAAWVTVRPAQRQANYAAFSTMETLYMRTHEAKELLIYVKSKNIEILENINEPFFSEEEYDKIRKIIRIINTKINKIEYNIKFFSFDQEVSVKIYFAISEIESTFEKYIDEYTTGPYYELNIDFESAHLALEACNNIIDKQIEKFNNIEIRISRQINNIAANEY